MSQDIISSFQRYEVKYFLTPRQREHLLPELEEHFKIDQYGLHTISNIYYDTDNYAITRVPLTDLFIRKNCESAPMERRNR